MSRFHRGALIFGIGIVTAGLLLGGCSKPPTEEFNAAKAAVDSLAMSSDVMQYAATEKAAAEAALADVDLKIQDKKYAEAVQALPDVTAKVEAAKAAAVANKEAAMKAAQDAANSAIAAAKQAVADAQGKVAKTRGAAKTALQKTIGEANTLVTEAETALAGGDVAGATAKAQEAAGKVAQ